MIENCLKNQSNLKEKKEKTNDDRIIATSAIISLKLIHIAMTLLAFSVASSL